MEKHHRETVLILEVQAKAALPIIESCAKMGLRVVAGAFKKHCSGFYSRAVRERLVYPPWPEEPDKCMRFLLDFLRRRKITMLFPVGDAMTALISKHQEEIRKYTKLVLPPDEIFIKGRSKILTLQAAQRAGCPIPHTWYPQSQPLEEIALEAKYPVLIKPAIAAGSRGITYCQSPEELLDLFPKIEEEFGDSFIQEFIFQTGIQYKVDVVLDYEGNLLAGSVYAKLRYYPPTGGSSVLNQTVRRPDILESALAVLRELKWVGFCDFDFITDPHDNVVKLMEINPRFPESFRATVAAGLDMTRCMYELGTGKVVMPQQPGKANRNLRFLVGDIMWFLTTKERRLAVRPPFLDFFREDTIYQLVRADDLGPIMGYFLENLSMLWDKDAREFRLRLKKKRR